MSDEKDKDAITKIVKAGYRYATFFFIPEELEVLRDEIILSRSIIAVAMHDNDVDFFRSRRSNEWFVLICTNACLSPDDVRLLASAVRNKELELPSLTYLTGLWRRKPRKPHKNKREKVNDS